MTWTDWNWINVFCMLFSTVVAAYCFNDDNKVGGWANLFASAVNFALIAVRLGF